MIKQIPEEEANMHMHCTKTMKAEGRGHVFPKPYSAYSPQNIEKFM